MLNQYILPITGLAGMIVSFYFLRKKRDKKYAPSLVMFFITFAVDLAVGIENPQPYWIIVSKVVLLAMGWITWFRAYSHSK